MKSILMSIRPEWCKKIFDGEKTIEVRKTRPLIDMPFKVLVYCTKAKHIPEDGLYFLPNDKQLYLGCKKKDLGFVCLEGDFRNGKVIGEFVCDKIDEYEANERGWYIYPQDETCLLCDEIAHYGKGKPLYGWHITEPKLFDKPRELTEFTLGRGFIAGRFPLTRPPRSWCYVEGGDRE